MWDFLRNKSRKKRAVVLVDYEYLYYSYKVYFGIAPDLAKWRECLEAKYDIAEMTAFGNFSLTEISSELVKVSAVVDKLVETDDLTLKRAIDSTDFIMLNYLYQNVDKQKRTEAYILVTGNGYFQSAIDYLVRDKSKELVVYGVKNAVNEKLLQSLAEINLLPLEQELYVNYRKLVIENMAYVAERCDIIPTFNGTIEVLAKLHGISKDVMVHVLRKMLDEGYLYRREQRVEFGKKVKVLAADWDRLIKSGLWNVEIDKACESGHLHQL